MEYRVLVLGAGGFIGRRLVEFLTGSDWAVPVAAVRDTSRVNFSPAVDVVTLDATDQKSLEKGFVGNSAVVNCVAGSARDIEQSAVALRAAMAASADPPRLVHLSSLAVYGRATGTVSELSALRGDLDAYSAAKVAAERVLEARPNVTILRPGIVYGPRSPLWSEQIARLLVSRRLGDIGRHGDGICNLLYVDDAVTAIARVLRARAMPQGPFNLAADPAPTWNDYFRAYADALGIRPAPQISTLRLQAEVHCVSPFLKIAEVLTRGKVKNLPPAIRPWLLERCGHSIRMDSTRATRSLDMKWTPLGQGLRETAQWFVDPDRGHG